MYKWAQAIDVLVKQLATPRGGLKAVALSFTLFCMVGVAQAGMVPPDELIRTTAQDVLEIVKQDEDIKAGNQKKILALVDAKVLPHFDFVRMTQLSVGKHWRKASNEQKQALVTEFRNMLVRTYTKAFTVYRDQQIEFIPFSMPADATEATVKTLINKPGQASIPVDYEMRKTANGWKAYDVSIEGISMVINYRSTFDTQIEKSGIDGLIKMLSDKNTDAANIALNKPEKK